MADTEHLQEQLETFLQSSALQGMSDAEKFAMFMAALNSSAESKPTEDAGNSNSCVQQKEFLFGENEGVYIYRHYGKNWYYREKDLKTNKWNNGESLKVGTNHDAARTKAIQQYLERQSKRARGILQKSITVKELTRRFLEHEQKRIKVTTKRGLTQDSYDSKIHKLTFWSKYIKENGHERRPIEDIPATLGELFASWIDDLPKAGYRDRPRSVSTINACVGATKSMYFWANARGYIGHDDIPKFQYLDASSTHSASDERQILWEHEWKQLESHLLAKSKNKDLKEVDRAKHEQTYWFFKLAYTTGMRLKEINTLKWNQVITPVHETDLSKKIKRSIYIPQTKTSRRRTITSEVAHIFNGLEKLYASRGVEIDRKSETRVFFKLFTNRVDQESWVTDKAMVDRLDSAMGEIGLKQKLEKEMPPRRITPNSARHYVATYLKVNEGWSWEDIALHLGHSKEETEQRYAKVTSAMITAKKKSQTGLSAIDTYIFRDPEGNPLPEEKQAVARQQVTELGLTNADQFTYEVVDGAMRLVLLLPEEEYNLAKEGIPEEEWNDLWQLKDGTQVKIKRIT